MTSMFLILSTSEHSDPIFNPEYPDKPDTYDTDPISNPLPPVNWDNYDPNPAFLNTNPMEKFKPENPENLNTDIPNILTIMTSRFLI